MKLDKYLGAKADVRPSAPPLSGGGCFSLAVVIPVRSENEHLPSTLEALAASSRLCSFDTLLLLVVNNPPPGGVDGAESAANARLLKRLACGEFAAAANLHVHVIDAASPGREIIGGVGRARKIGMDSALAGLGGGGESILVSLDADTLVDRNYLQAIDDCFSASSSLVGATVSFAHRLPDHDPALSAAMVCYELYLRHHVLGLGLAGSPYAYHALGSAFACRAAAYVKAGGMRSRVGGEDFYFLQELRKLGRIGEITCARVYPSARLSRRVPFGTGPSLEKILSGGTRICHHPRVYRLLCDTLRSVGDWVRGDSDPAALADLIPAESRDFLWSVGFHRVWSNIRKHTPEHPDQLSWAFHRWFDAFRSLKFIHHLERRHAALHPRLEPLEAFRALGAAFPESPISGLVARGTETVSERALLLRLRKLSASGPP